MNIMLRWALRIAIFLLLGAIVNVAVAWVIVLANDDVEKPPLVATQLPNRISHTRLGVSTRFGYQFVSDYGRGPLGFLGKLQSYQGRIWWSNPECNGPEFWNHVGAGWPMLSLSASTHTILDLEAKDKADRVVHRHGGIALNQAAPSNTPVVLPVRPLWTGFIVNVLVYATSLGMLMLGPTAIRSLRCRWRGVCLACGYPRGTSPVCTECGEPLPSDRPR